MSVKNLKSLIKLIVEEVLGEPDLSSEEERNPEDKKSKSEKEVEEQNTVVSAAPGGMGPNMPLGVGPSYPAIKGKKKKKKKKKS
tara:strand:+ start:365 stop:616 length:252 start_codon:yes stop_codon:yes gene_type:complete